MGIAGRLRLLPFRGSAAVASGAVTKARLCGPRSRRLFPDVHVASDVPMDHRLWCYAALLYAGPGTAISGLGAAFGWGVDLLPISGAPPEVTVPPPRRPAIAKGRLTVVRSRLDNGDACDHGTLRLTSPVRTAFDLARRQSLPDAVVSIDALLARNITTLAELSSYYALHGGVRGVAQVPTVVDLAEPRSESPMETRCRSVIVDGGLPRPVAQHEVRTPSGLFVARLDLAYPKWMIGIEYEGDHHRERVAFRRDIARGNALADLGWSIVRVTADDVLRRPDEMVRRIAKLISIARR